MILAIDEPVPGREGRRVGHEVLQPMEPRETGGTAPVMLALNTRPLWDQGRRDDLAGLARRGSRWFDHSSGCASAGLVQCSSRQSPQPARCRSRASASGWHTHSSTTMPTVQVRYIVRDVDAAIDFYVNQLAFRLEMHPAPAFAMLSLGDLRLVLSAPNPAGGGGQPMPDGTQQQPGGWNRFAVQVSDLSTVVERLRAAGAHFRNNIVGGVGGRQIIVDDPSGNPVELFEPTIDAAQLTHR